VTWSWSVPEAVSLVRHPRRKVSRRFVRTLVLGLFACLGAVLAAPPLAASTVLSREVHLAVAADGSITERFALHVRLDEAGDLDDWSPYPIPLDANRTLISASGQAVRPDGTRVALSGDELESVEGVSGAGILHSSTAYRLVRFPPLPAGSELSVAYEVREEPWFTSGAIVLVGEDPVDRLTVRIETPPGSAAREGLRWRIDGASPAPAPSTEPDAEGGDGSSEGAEGAEGADTEEPWTPDGIDVEETADGLVLRGANLAGIPAEEGRSVLRYAWGSVRTWADVARWYTELTRDVPRGGPEIDALAREATAGAESPRERIAALLDRVRSQVRYVAVEVGVGGYRPSTPADVLERRWGDCKDKAFLLIDLLHAVGIEADPVLVLLDREQRIDDQFPGPEQFNHLIVAVPTSELNPRAEDVTADGYLFLDPTQTRGGLTWIHPALQGQRALVVDGEAPGLVTLPVASAGEVKELAVRLTVGDGGGAVGEAELRLSGHGAWRLSEGTATASPERLSEVSRRLFATLLDGATIGDPRWREGEVDGLPLVELSVPIRFERFLQGRTVESMALPGPAAFPEISDLEDLHEPLSAGPVRWTVTWTLSLPPGRCPPDGPQVAVENRVGRFVQEVSSDGDAASGSTVRVERRAEVAVRWIEGDDVEPARALALAERRTSRRRLRLRCPDAGGS